MTTAAEEDNKVRVHKTVDKLLMLDCGTLLLGRVIVQEKDRGFVHVFRPVALMVSPDGQMHMGRWIPESSDELFFIPANKITNVSNPNPMLCETYVREFLIDAEETEEGSQTADVPMAASMEMSEDVSAEHNSGESGKANKSRLH